MNFGHPLAELVDGNVKAGNGLDMDRGQFEEQSIIFATAEPVSAQVFQFTLWHYAVEKGYYPAEIELAVTSDPNPVKESSWKVLKPDVAINEDFALIPDSVMAGKTTVTTVPGLPRMVLTIRATSPLTGVTGFRLRLLRVDADHISGQPVIGRSPSGNCVINEFQVEPDPLRSSNIALGRPVRPSGMVHRELYPHYLTDGLAATFSHPADDQPARDFYFEVDLGEERPLDHLVVRGRLDGFEPERLANYEIHLLADDGNGQPGKLLWRAALHRDGSPVPPGGSDLIQAADGAGERFAARFVRIVNPGDTKASPQVGEIEVYPELQPRLAVRGEGKVLDSSYRMPPATQRLDFTISPGGSDPVPELLVYRWRQTGTASEWTECRPGVPGGIALGNPGTYGIEFQARHTDGRWDRKVQSATFTLPAPWWQDPSYLAVIILATLLVAAGIAWRTSVVRLKRKLERADAARIIEQDRLRIARDMHDDIGARLTHLALLADRVKRSSPGYNDPLLSKLAGEARGTVGALDQIVWAVNPHHDTLGSLVDYVCHHATEYLTDSTLSCLLEMEPHDRDAIVPFSIRHPLLMAMKEALQNVVKHSGASEVIIDLKSSPEAIELSVTDDGKGIELPADTASGEDGVANMQSRLAEIGGKCSIGKSPSGGTRVLFTVPWKTSK